MKLSKLFLTFAAVVAASILSAQPYQRSIAPLPDERWWGGMTAIGSSMPFPETMPEYDLGRNNLNNQIVPLMLSSAGRYIWSEHPFRFSMSGDTLLLISDKPIPEPVEAGSTLKEAYLAASAAHFQPSGKLPEDLFFSRPQYNTWIELMYDQNQRDIMDYAYKVVENGFPEGVFMIDDNWQKYYGNFDFKPEKFADPKMMTDSLHAMGFKVMVWIAPFVSPDSPEYRILADKGYLVMELGTDKPAIINWWNGFSACYDVTNPQAAEFLKSQLRRTQELYGVDGYKIDGGDVAYMTGQYDFYDAPDGINDFSQKWAEIALDFPYNELRTSWKLGGRELVQRLGDKDYSWGAVSLLIPDMMAAGLLGHLYTCPDMIGGGQYGAFLNIDSDKFDQELIVRSCQIHAMMPMMQFSVAPWRILDAHHLAICRKFARFHQSMGAYLLETARNSARTGEPIVRNMEYAFPHQGLADCKDQFMLGEKYLVAPMIIKGSSREVWLPTGVWKDEEGHKFRGPKRMTVEVPLDRLPYYERIK